MSGSTQIATKKDIQTLVDDQVLSKTQIDELWDHVHSAQRVAPALGPPITLTSGIGAYTLGAFSADIIAAGNDDSAGTLRFDCHGLDIQDPSGNGDFEIRLYGTVFGVNDVDVGQCTFSRINATTLSRGTFMMTKIMDAGSRLRAKMADSVGARTCNVKVWYHNYA